MEEGGYRDFFREELSKSTRQTAQPAENKPAAGGLRCPPQGASTLQHYSGAVGLLAPMTSVFVRSLKLGQKARGKSNSELRR
jgi:hypothetical protein